MPKLTNTQLAHKIEAVGTKQTTFENYVKGKFRDWSPKIDSMHDYLVGQEAIKNQPKGSIGVAEMTKIILGIISFLGVIGSTIILVVGK